MLKRPPVLHFLLSYLSTLVFYQYGVKDLSGTTKGVQPELFSISSCH